MGFYLNKILRYWIIMSFCKLTMRLALPFQEKLFMKNISSTCFKRWSSALPITSENNGSKVPLITKKILPPQFEVLHFDSTGDHSSYTVSKTSLSSELSVPARALRFQHSNMMNVRDQKIIMRFQELKAIICPDGLLLIDFFSPGRSQSREMKQFREELPTLLAGYEINPSSNLPFEYRALEALMAYNISKFDTALAELEPDIIKLLNALTDPTQPTVDRSLVHVLLHKSTLLNTFDTSVKLFIEAIEEWLENDDDFHELCISISPENQSNTPETPKRFTAVDINSN